MKIDLMRKVCAVACAVYAVFCLLLYWTGGETLKYKDADSLSVSASYALDDLGDDTELRQSFTAEGNEILGLSLVVSGEATSEGMPLQIVLLDAESNMIGHASGCLSAAADKTALFLPLDTPVSVQSGEQYTFELTFPGGETQARPTLWYGKTFSVARGEIAKDIPESERMRVNEETKDGMLCLSVRTREYYWFGQHFPLIALIGAAVLLAGCFLFMKKAKKGQVTFVHRVIDGFQKYSYLMRQLISRDFKTKYKRSVLGVLWSFLNPLLTMGVQFIVFSKVFKTDIPNFPLYLLSGIVCYNFFSEATTMSLVSIVHNAHLITKVYVPKYIYPTSRILSSTINLLLALIPLLGVMIITGAPFKPVLLMLPFGLLCLVGLCVGMGFILSTSMVFFRDTQFLWGVLNMLWMYLTPIFYPETIVPERYLPIYRCNPLYHIIRFVRTILIDGMSPDPQTYALCFLSAVIPFTLGVFIFKKHQDQFILNL